MFSCLCSGPRHHNEEGETDRCFCGMASVQLQSPRSKLKKTDVAHLTFKNDNVSLKNGNESKINFELFCHADVC